MSARPTQKAHARFHDDDDFRAQLREFELADHIWDAIVSMYRKRQAEDGLSQAEWAARANRPATFINRLLRRPKNLTSSTVARALSALDAYLDVQVVDARAAAPGANASLPPPASTVRIMTDNDVATGVARPGVEVSVLEAVS